MWHFHNRKPTEGQLSKWTNLMKGWQFRWFTLDPDSGSLEYYVVSSYKQLLDEVFVISGIIKVEVSVIG